MIRFTEQAEYLHEILTWKTRGLTSEQAARVVQAKFGEMSDSDRDLGILQRANFARSATFALVLVEPTSPLKSWSPGQGSIEAATTCWQLEQRWRSARTRRVTVHWATDLGARHFGGVADFAKYASQIEHDLGTASVLARLHEIRPDVSAGWVGEMILRRDYMPHVDWLKKIPDAAIILDGRVNEFIEFCGQYSTRRLRRFHEHCRRFSIPYTLW